ncbi:MAG: HlyD family efflux transporter periplasmic adaptor subunit [Alphaproteobacteria bacterium]|nr:HlyD family efflux transporter periplasmic adaptor subunit [Alphaproteobacteria bacterium]
MDLSVQNAGFMKRGLAVLAVLLVVGGFYYALSPSPVAVDTAVVGRGDLLVTVDEEGKTRIKDVFVVSAPTSGRVLRTALEVGDAVEAGKTTVVAVEPSPPPFLDLRSRRELQAQIEAARASVELAKAEVNQAKAELEFATSDYERAESLSKKQVVSDRTLEKARIDVETRRAAVARAEANRLLRERELESAMARLIGPENSDGANYATGCCVSVRAPVSGRVLSIMKKSEQIVPQGTPLLEIGDPENLEITVELLSADAVRVPVGAPVFITAWGGRELTGKVGRIEPAGFTKVSALGIEEQRVRVIVDFDPEAIGEATARLGHDFRVFVRIVVEDQRGVLLAPLGAMFRQKDEWAAYVAEDGVAFLRKLELGHRNALRTVVLSGLAEGERIILHPSDRVLDGVRIVERAELN